MTVRNQFCTSCGAPLTASLKFCTQCGQAVASPAAASLPVTGSLEVRPDEPPVAGMHDGMERILGIVPFIEQGLLSVIHSTLVITDRRLIFCTWDPDTDESMSEADDAVMQESCDISGTEEEIAHFRAKDWSAGPWQRYRSLAPDTIIAGAPGTIAIALRDIVDAEITCETITSTQDTLRIRDAGKEYVFDLMHSQGLHISRILSPLLGERLTTADHLHRRGKLDRLLSGQEYR